jgi:lysophospholipase L1-like esterase
MNYHPSRFLRSLLIAALFVLSASAQNTNSFCGFGDSLVALGSTDLQYGPSVFNVTHLLSQGQIQFVHNGGVGGQNTTQILARINTDALSQPCNLVLVTGGTNDLGSVATATTKANLLSIYTRIAASGKTPIAMTIPPYNLTNFVNEIATLNAWIRSVAGKLNIPLLDMYAITVDPTTGNYRTGYSTDGIHPTGIALRLVAQKFLSDLQPLLTTSRHPLLPAVNTDPNNLIPNGLMINSTGGIPTGCNTFTANGNYAFTVATDTNISGNAMVITKSATTGGDSSGESCYFINSGYSVGDRMAFAGKSVVTGAEAGTLIYNVQLYIYSSGFGSLLQIISPIAVYTGTDIPAAQWYMEFPIPATAAIIQVQVTLGTGIGVLKLGQLGLYNLTTMGLYP